MVSPGFDARSAAISPASIPSIVNGPSARTGITWSAAMYASGKPRIASARTGGDATSPTVASSTIAQVPSVPTSARARSKPFSGRSWSRL